MGKRKRDVEEERSGVEIQKIDGMVVIEEVAETPRKKKKKLHKKLKENKVRRVKLAKKKKLKRKVKQTEDEVVDETMEENSEDVKSAKKKKKKRKEKIDETGANNETEAEEIVQSPKKKKRTKHEKKENNNISLEQECSKPDKKDDKKKREKSHQAVKRKTERFDEETKEKLKREWKDRLLFKKLNMQKPKMFLTGIFTNDEDPKTALKPVKVEDLKYLIQYSVMSFAANLNRVRFCKLVRPALIPKVVVMVLNSMSDGVFQENRDCFPHLTANYNLTGQILPLESQERQSVLSQLLYVEVSNRQLKEKRYSLGGHIKKDGATAKEIPTVHQPVTLPASNKTTMPGRTHYLLQDYEKVMWRYPSPYDPKYVHTTHLDTVTENSPLIAVDCEMCVTRMGSELTRVSLVDEKYNVLYNSLVKPRNPIFDYVTRFSGITKKLLDPVKTRIEDVQRDIIALLPPDAILVGQSLEHDLRALKLYHPHVIDTSYMFTGSYRVALRKLASKYLGITIQGSESGHDSIEDAETTLKLLQLKIERGSSLEKYNSNNSSSSSSININSSINRNSSNNTNSSNNSNNIEKQMKTVPTESIFRGGQSLGKVSMIVDSVSVVEQFIKDPVGARPCRNDSQALKTAVQAIQYSDFMCVQFHNYFKLTQGISEEGTDVKETLKQMDKRIQKINKRLPSNSIFLVVMAKDPRSANNKSDKVMEQPTHGRFFMGLKVK